MRIEALALQGVFLVKFEPIEDSRGSLGRIFCADEFQKHGLDPRIAQCSVSASTLRGTLRGMHYQAAPHAEAKLVRCTRGAVYDVALDLRPESAAFTKWIAVELSAESRDALYLPEGVAHGFQTLVDGVEMHYQISVPYSARFTRGVRWNDPAFAIRWPIGDPVLAERDASYPDFVKP